MYKAWLVLLDWSIGFGYHLEFAFYWAAFFVLLGWAVLYATGQRTKLGITLGLAYSFDMLLPLVQLRKKHYDIDLDPWPRRYFYTQDYRRHSDVVHRRGHYWTYQITARLNSAISVRPARMPSPGCSPTADELIE